jgi:hypothetical protein
VAEAVVLRCAYCGLPWAKVQNGVLIVESHHHSDKHVNVIPLDELKRVYEEAQQQERPVRRDEVNP